MVSSEEHSFKSLGLNSASKSRLSRSVSPWSFLIEPSPWCPRFEEEEEDDDDAAEDVYWSRSRIFSGCRVLYISLYSGWCTLYLVSRFMGIVLLSDLAGWVCWPFFSGVGSEHVEKHIVNFKSSKANFGEKGGRVQFHPPSCSMNLSNDIKPYIPLREIVSSSWEWPSTCCSPRVSWQETRAGHLGNQSSRMFGLNKVLIGQLPQACFLRLDASTSCLVCRHEPLSCALRNWHSLSLANPLFPWAVFSLPHRHVESWSRGIIMYYQYTVQYTIQMRR